MNPESPWLTPAQAAAYLGSAFTKGVVQKACREGRLQHVRPGGNRILTTRAWLNAWCMSTVEGVQNGNLQAVCS